MKKNFLIFSLLIAFSCKTEKINIQDQLVEEACNCIITNSEGVTKKRFKRKIRKDCIKKIIYQNSEELKKEFNGKSVAYNFKYYEQIFTEKINQNCPKTLKH